MKQIYAKRTVALLLLLMLPVASALSQSIYSVEPPSKLKATQPYLGFAVSIPLIKVFKPISRLFKKVKSTESEVTRQRDNSGNLLSLYSNEWEPYWPELPLTPDDGQPTRASDSPSGGGGGGGGELYGDFKYGDYRIPGFSAMYKQILNTCVTSIMEKVLREKCRLSTNEGEIILYYYQKFGKDVIKDGVDANDINELVSHFFNFNAEAIGKQRQTIVAYLFQQIPVMIDIATGLSGVRHNVLITGYNLSTNEYIILDPDTGKESRLSADVVDNQTTYKIPLLCK